MSNYTEQDYWVDDIQRALYHATARLEEELIRQEILMAYYECRPLRDIVLPPRPYEWNLPKWPRPTTRIANLAVVDVQHIYL